MAGTGVALGAFGVHGLRTALSPAELALWNTGVTYQVWHGLALVAIGAARLPLTSAVAWLIGLGCLVFASTLYAMAFSGPRWLGTVTPIGGVLMIAGWALLAWRAWRSD